jgi:SP family facilitated glucose transporter-like MFS transporter 1
MESNSYLDRPHLVTMRLGWSTAIICLSTLQFGYHLAELNAPLDILSCVYQKSGPLPSYDDTFWYKHNYNQCIPMNDRQEALVTTMFTVGGLFASILLGATSISSVFGRKFLCLVNAFLFTGGSLAMALTNSSLIFNLGRFVNGVAAGTSLIVTPILINELTPINQRGFLGSLLQLAVAVGIFIAQVVSYFCSNDQDWRLIFVFALMIGLVQFILLLTINESPKWLIMHRGEVSRATSLLRHLRSDKDTVMHEVNHWRKLSSTQRPDTKPTDTSALLSHEASVDSLILQPLTRVVSRRNSYDDSTLSTSDFVFSAKYRKEFIAVLLLMTSQQLTGVNSITFYGVRILNGLFKGANSNVLLLSCSFSLCNVITAFLVSHVVDRWGRKPLMIASVSMTAICSFLIAVGIKYSKNVLAVVACFGFIIGYSIGLGPIPFLMISELTHHDVVSIAQSLGTSSNWASSMLIAYLFPQLQAYFGGSVFFIFFIISVAYFFGFAFYIPETKGYNNCDDVWDRFQE